MAGGRKRGVIILDPAGRQQSLPFSSGGIQVLTSNGTFEDSQVAWGNITGNIEDQTDLQNALDLKQDRLEYCPELGAYLIKV